MKKELFDTYKEMVKRCIESCVTPEQLLVAFDLKDRFRERFESVVEFKEFNAAIDELHNTYIDKQTQLHF